MPSLLMSFWKVEVQIQGTFSFRGISRAVFQCQGAGRSRVPSQFAVPLNIIAIRRRVHSLDLGDMEWKKMRENICAKSSVQQ
jgi:hypothetical protein